MRRDEALASSPSIDIAESKRGASRAPADYSAAFARRSINRVSGMIKSGVSTIPSSEFNQISAT